MHPAVVLSRGITGFAFDGPLRTTVFQAMVATVQALWSQEKPSLAISESLVPLVLAAMWVK
ncbi:MAG TPA: hypothetical protein DEB46_06490 [Myxococcales bacterium]|nr:hypothetical protein [Myxococcales bacterium]